MDARAIFLADHSRIHAAAISTEDEMKAAGGFTMQDDTLKRLTEADLRANPEGLCSIVWHLWHMTRIEDVVTNSMLRGEREILDRDGWLDRLGVDVRLVGTGDSDEEVRGFSERVDVSALLAYREAVGRETRAWVRDLDFATLDTVPDLTERLASAPPIVGERGALAAAVLLRQDQRVPADLPGHQPRLHALGRSAGHQRAARPPAALTERCTAHMSLC